MIKLRNLDPEVRAMIEGSAPGMAERIYCVNPGDAPDSYFNYKRPSENVHPDLLAAYNSAVDARNDSIIVTPSNHSLGASLTWSKNMTHCLGSYVGSKMNIRNRIGMSTAFTPMILVSGFGNTFANIYTMHGTDAADLVGWEITGDRNSFYGVHFGGPMDATQAGTANYRGIDLTSGQENYFKDCVIGTSTQARDEADPNILFGPPGRHIFEDCIFQLYAGDGDPTFCEFANTSTLEVFFRNCQFVALNANWATAITVAFEFTGGATAGVYLDQNCQFYNVTKVCASADDQLGVWYPRTHADTTDASNFVAYRPTL